MKKLGQGKWVLIGLSAALLIAVGAFTLTQLPAPASSRAGSSSDSGPSSSATPSTGGDGSGASQAPATKAPATGGSTPPAAGKRFTTEVEPAKPAGKAGIPKSTPLPYPVTAPLPKSSSASGKLASGYPEKVLPAAPESDVDSSSVSSQGSHLQVTLAATSAKKVDDLLVFYRAALAKYGMYDKAAPAVGGSTAVTFSRDGDSVTLTATPADDGGTSYTLFGAFTAKG